MRSKRELITIFSNNEATVTVKCIHNTRARTLFLSKGINSFCNCHIADGCVLYFNTYESGKESLVEIPGSKPDKRFFMLYTANGTGGGQSVGSLQDICIGTVLSNGGGKLLKEKIPGVVTRHVAAKGSCLLPYCINTRLSICTERCKIQNNICSLITSRPYPFIYFRALNEYGMGRRNIEIACVHTHVDGRMHP